MKQFINGFLNKFGYEINKKVIRDANLYENFPVESLKNKRFYNIGAGLFNHIYWTNIDYATEHYKRLQKFSFINYDLLALQPLPIEDNVAEFVYSSHTVEHVSDEAVFNMFNEAYRILKPGGGIRITTPNAWLEFQSYKRNDLKYWYWISWYTNPGTWEKLYTIPLNKASIHQIFLHHFASQLCEIGIDDTPSKKYSDSEIIETFSEKPLEVALDFFTKRCKFNPDHPGNHMNWWTYEKLFSMLKNAGFSNPFASGYGQSLCPALRNTTYFDNTHPKISLYVEAYK